MSFLEHVNSIFDKQTESLPSDNGLPSNKSKKNQFLSLSYGELLFTDYHEFIFELSDIKIVLDDNQRLLSTYTGFKNGIEVTVKDIGPQLAWTTVRIVGERSLIFM